MNDESHRTLLHVAINKGSLSVVDRKVRRNIQCDNTDSLGKILYI